MLSVEGNFHGRTIGIISMSTDPESRKGFGPYLEGVGPEWEHTGLIRYNHPKTLSARSRSTETSRGLPGRADPRRGGVSFPPLAVGVVHAD